MIFLPDPFCKLSITLRYASFPCSGCNALFSSTSFSFTSLKNFFMLVLELVRLTQGTFDGWMVGRKVKPSSRLFWINDPSKSYT